MGHEIRDGVGWVRIEAYPFTQDYYFQKKIFFRARVHILSNLPARLLYEILWHDLKTMTLGLRRLAWTSRFVHGLCGIARNEGLFGSRTQIPQFLLSTFNPNALLSAFSYIQK